MIQKEVCPSCGAPIEVPERSSQTKCPYCLASLTIERNSGDIELKTAEKVVGSIESSGNRTQSAILEGTTITQIELKRLQLSQDLSNTQLRLSNVQSEIRTLERTQLDRITKTQLSELRSQESTLKRHISMLQDTLYPVPVLHASDQSSVGQRTRFEPSRYTEGLLPLLFSFRGRIARKQFWIGFGIGCIILWLALLSGNTVSDPTTGITQAEPSPISNILMIPGLWIFLAVNVKRFRDRGRSGWWTAIYLVPPGFIWAIYELGFRASKFSQHTD